jgi:predicted ATPase/DNA-binding XRE family transcriptional regulator
VAEQAGLDFGGLLRRLRDDAGLTQEELAEAARVSRRAVSDLERGINRTAHKDTAVLLAGALALDGRARELFVAAARGRVPAGEVLAAVDGRHRGTFAAARTRSANLPAQLSAFIGREKELAEVRALVESSRLVTLTGAGGCGKTRLSLQVAAGLLDGSGDGVWLVELAAITGQDAVAPAICQALALAAQPGRAALDTVLDALAPLDMLIVLDNCEHLIGGCAKSADAILRHCPKVRLLATSREPLRIHGEALYRVLPLSRPRPGDTGVLAAESSDAVALFADRAGAQGTGLTVDEETAPLVVSICARLDGLPLAIELAAARLRFLSLGDLHDRLDQRFRLLTGGDRTAPARQQTLQAAVEWSYSLLTGAEQVLLGRLPVFADSFDLDAAEAIGGFGGISAADVADLLGSLVDKSLVVAEARDSGVRYRLLETIRQFAAERLAEAGEEQAAAVAAAHCAHYLSVAETAAPHLTGPGQGRWLARLDAEQANLRRAAEHAAGRPDGTSRVLRFGAALRRYWLTRVRHEEAVGLLIPALDRPAARADPGLFGEALVTAAELARGHDMTVARRLGEQAVDFGRQRADDRLLAYSLATLGSTYYFTGEPDKGHPLAEEAVQRARRLGDDVLLAESLVVFLMFSGISLEAARAGRLFDEAIVCTERSGDQLIRFTLHNNASVYLLRAGDLAAARDHLEQAGQAAQAAGAAVPHVPVNLGWVLRQENDLDGARDQFETALRVSRRTGERSSLAVASLGLACVAADLADCGRAATLHGTAQAFVERAGQLWQEPEASYRRDSLHKVRTSLGEEQFERAYSRGRALSFDQAIDLVLGECLPAT